MSLSGVACAGVLANDIPGTVAAVQKYSTFGSLAIPNLNCVGLA
jgi:hypothetical protein